MKVTFNGSCLSGAYSILEISPNDKFTFNVLEDSKTSFNVPLNINNITVKNHLVAIGKSPKINVVEHLFSALYGLNLFNVKIDCSGNEIPFFDGSSQTLVKSLSKIEEYNSPNLFSLNKPILVKEKDSFIQYTPLAKDNLVIEMELSHPYINTQEIVLDINRENYIKEIAPARTFVFTSEADPRLKNLPPYGIAITKKRIYCATPLRFSNELIRHKVLDLLGDLYVLQRKLVGKVTCKNTSHQLNLKFIRKLINEMNRFEGLLKCC